MHCASYCLSRREDRFCWRESNGQPIQPFPFRHLRHYARFRTLGEDPMHRTVAHLNIQHFRKLLATEKDETKRQTLRTAFGRGRGQSRFPKEAT